MMLDIDLTGQEIMELASAYEARPPQDLLRWTLERFGSRAALCTSLQADGMVILDMAWRLDSAVRVFTIDTGRLPQESYDFLDRVRETYRIDMGALHVSYGRGSTVGNRGRNSPECDEFRRFLAVSHPRKQVRKNHVMHPSPLGEGLLQQGAVEGMHGDPLIFKPTGKPTHGALRVHRSAVPIGGPGGETDFARLNEAHHHAGQSLEMPQIHPVLMLA